MVAAGTCLYWCYLLHIAYPADGMLHALLLRHTHDDNVGHFHGRPYWDHIVLPLDEGFREIMRLCVAVSQLSAAVLRSSDANGVAALQSQIDTLVNTR